MLQLKYHLNLELGNRVGNSHFLVRNPQVQSPYTSGWQFIPGDRVSQARDTTADKNPDMTLRYNKSDPTLDTTVESLTIGDGDSFRGSVPPESQRGGKPVIYLFSPETLDVTVSLALVPEWEFSAVYPVAPIKSTPLGQRITWDVRTKSNGDLTECASGLDVSYLFWEAEYVYLPHNVCLYFTEYPIQNRPIPSDVAAPVINAYHTALQHCKLQADLERSVRWRFCSAANSDNDSLP